MIHVKNRLITGIISRIIRTVLSGIYKLLSLFNLQVPLLVLVVGTILFFVGALENQTLLNVLKVAFCIAIVFSLIKTVKKLLGVGKQPKVKKTKSGVQITQTEPDTQCPTEQTQPTVNKYPVYYGVKQNPDYIMAEFEDRFELYKKTAQGLVRIRTDYKERRV